MRRDQLEHAIRAACDVSGDTELLIFGSQAILGSHPLAPESLRASIEAAVLPNGWDQRTVAVCDLQGTRGNTGYCWRPMIFQRASLPPVVRRIDSS